jgi:hypothetical protein
MLAMTKKSKLTKTNTISSTLKLGLSRLCVKGDEANLSIIPGAPKSTEFYLFLTPRKASAEPSDTLTVLPSILTDT